MTLGKSRPLAFAAVLSVALLAGAPSIVNAESACQGLEQSVCAGKASCTWVGGYKRSDGIEVSGYCRITSGGKKTKTSTTSGQQATSQG